MVRRVLQACVVVVGVSVIVFTVIHMLPGGPARAVLGLQATPLEVRQFMVANGYNQPLWVQFVLYWKHLLGGNLGFSYQQDLPVATLLSQDLPKTALLVGLAFAVAIVVGIPVGILQAVRRNRPLDHLFTSLVFVGYSMPVFWVGMLLIVLLAVNARLLPAEAPQGVNVGEVLAHPAGLVLPVMTLAIVITAGFSRFTRSSAVENLAQDYVRTARAKGVSGFRILLWHVLPNSLLPVITLIGLSLPAILSGSVIVETVFNYPGMGLLFWNAAVSRDYPVLLGVTLVLGVATVLGSLLADILYAVADPRVRY
ncbi:MAG: ABC transporter permease [Candidatus Dormibacteria bacterium]